ncbi:hypothetical protein HS125_11795 [bacterium]|nr:hypothetical protein [bacterium]
MSASELSHLWRCCSALRFGRKSEQVPLEQLLFAFAEAMRDERWKPIRRQRPRRKRKPSNRTNRRSLPATGTVVIRCPKACRASG